MAAPTLSAFSNSNFTDTPASGSETTGSVSWSSGDIVVVLGVTEDNVATTLGTPTTTGTGLTFAALTGFPTNTASNTKVYGWSATASATSSGTISSTMAGGGATHASGICVWVWSASGGIGNTATAVGDTTDPYTASLTRAGTNSAVCMIAGDWNAISDAANDPSPLTGSTEKIGDNAGFVSGRYTGYAAHWADEGASGTTSYGVTGIAGGKITVGAVEVKGSAAAGITYPQLERGIRGLHRGVAMGGYR